MIEPTSEQKEIIKQIFKEERLKIKAFAGSGKTSTLKMIAEAYPEKNFLYLAFNRKIADEAIQKFPKNVKVSTVHSFVYREWMRIRKGKTICLMDSFNAHTINALFGYRFKEREFEIPEAIKRAFNLFCYSDFSSFKSPEFVEFLKEDVELANLLEQHAFMTVMDKAKKQGRRMSDEEINKEKEKIKEGVFEEVLECAENIYEAMKREEAPWTHDFYLKYFIEEYGERLKHKKFDCILLDEAQDSNPVILKFFEKFSARKVMVGDPHQQIYAWRGSVNIMDEFEGEELNLSVSFRFPQEIAEVLNRVLSYKGEETSIVGKGVYKKNGNGKVAILSRSNSTLISYMLKLKEFRITRYITEIFRNVLLVNAIKNKSYYIPELRQSVPEIYWRYFDNFLGFIEDVGKRNDKELMNAVKIVLEYEDVREVFRNAVMKVRDNARVVLSTVHSAKGLEWDVVCVADDFMDFRKAYRELVSEFDDFQSLKRWVRERKVGVKERQFIEELNLYYVALSRAKGEIVDETVNKWMWNK